MFFFFKQKTAYELRISDCSSDVCSSDLFERGIDQVFHDFLQLIKLERIDPAARTVNADMAGMARIIRADIIAYRLFPFARFGDHMDQAHIVHFLGAINLSPQDHSFSMNMADAKGENGIGANAGEQSGKDFRRSE